MFNRRESGLITLNIKTMGFFSGLVETAFSPVKLVTKTTTKVFDEDWEIKDALTCGLTKVLKAAEEEVEDIKDAFDE